MKKASLVFLVFLIALGSVAAASQVRFTPLKIRERTLENGLRVFSVQDNSIPTVAIRVWYNVGGKDDPQGKSGFAHMFEHMMFKSTKNMPSEKMDRLTEDVGGFNNASTWDDYTDYYEVVPSNHLERLLWAEAERMQNLNVDDANFASERDVVKEEFRQSVLAQPYGRLFEYINSLSYSIHPYKRGVIGDLEQLSAATSADARLFHQTYYRPDNACLIVVGDFIPKELDDWTDKYFGPLTNPNSTIPRVTAKEPARTREMRYEKTAPNVPFPAVAITYLAPRSSHPDSAALDIAATILSGGESSRLYQSLVYKQQIAQEASFTFDMKVDGGLLYFFAVASEGNEGQALERSLIAELKLIQAKGVSPRELARAKNQMISQSIIAVETNDGKAQAIQHGIAYDNDPRAINMTVAKIQAVTAADVRRVMRKYFSDSNRVVIHYKNEGGSK